MSAGKTRSAFPLRRVATLCACVCGLLALPSAALAARGHVLLSEFGTPGSGLGQLSEPFGLAFDEQGHSAYVADHGNNRVQRFSYNAVAKKYEYASQITAATGEGSGILSEGSKTVTSLSTSAGLFVPNQTIEGPGIPSGEGTGDLSVASGEGELHLLAKGEGSLTAGSTEITGVSVESGAFAVGESIAAQEGIPLGATIPADATIVSCSPSCGSPTSLTISKPAEITGHVHLLSGSKEITNLSVSSGAFAVGEEFDPHTVRGYLQRGTTIVSCSPSCTSPTSLTVSSGAVDEGPHSLLAASHEVANLNTSSGEFAVGQAVSGPGIPVGATITAASPTSLTITALPTEAKTAAPLSAHTTIASVSGSTLTLSSKATQSGSASLNAEQKLSRDRFLAVDNATSSESYGDLYVTTQIEKESVVSTVSFERIGVLETVVDKFSSSGEFIGQITHLPPTTGTGDLTAGSTWITSVARTSPGFFLEGETISGPGIPPGTKIAACKFNGNGNVGCSGANELGLSNPVEAGGTATGAAFSAENPPFNSVGGLAVDPAGSLWLLEEHGVGIVPTIADRFDSALANQFQASCVAPASGPGLTVDSHGNAYVRTVFGNGGVLEAASNCKTIQGSIGAEAPDAANGVSYGGLAVETTSNDLYLDNLTSIGRFSPAGSEIERFGSGEMASESCDEFSHGVASCLGGLAVDSATGEVLAAVGKKGKVAVFGLEPPTVPKLENEGVSQVTNDSAILEGEVNPRSLGGEAPTTYSFQYGPCSGGPASCAGAPFPATTSPSTFAPSFEVEAASSLLEGLAPGTTYHFRLLAENSHGPAAGAERIFTTFSPGEFALPDARQWEMVSPPDLHGTLIVPLNNGPSTVAPIQSTPGGDAFTFATVGPTESDPAGNDNGTQVFSTRSPGAGWASHDITIPHLEAATTSNGPGQEARFFSADLSQAVFQQFGPFSPVTPAASEQTPYLYDTAPRSFTPLVTGCPAEGECPAAVEALADVPAGTVFGNQVRFMRGPTFRGATSDLSHVVLASDVALTETPLKGNVGLYEWSAAAAPAQRLQLVSLLPGAGEKPASSAALGYSSSSNDTRGAISADGSRVFFSGGNHLYMRDTAAQKTVQLDQPEAGCGGCANGFAAEFQLASVDGSRAFFTDKSRLTAGSGASSGGREAADLYECQIIEGSGGPECKLTDLTPETGGEAAAVQGTIAGASADGEYVYFVANGALAPGATPGRCDGNPAHTCNLYLRHAGATTFIATLSALDNPDWSSGAAELGALTVRVSPNGNWLAFMSRRPLTGYDNRDASSGKPDEEVYLYEAAHGRLTCASCNPTGARPHGVELSTAGQSETLPLSRGRNVWREGTWLAAGIPGWTDFEIPTAAYQSRYLSNTGHLFFNSTDGLVAKDSNGVGDVYEFEPEGEGSCTSAATNGALTYRPARPFEAQGRSGEEGVGCVALLSSGTSSEESAFLDASESGQDVFFLSSARLSPADVEGGRTVYDAHVCTAASPCPPPEAPKPPVCTGDACQQPASAPNHPTPGTAILDGPENALECPSGRVLRGGRCVARHPRKHHRKKHRRARRNRGGHR